MNQGFVVNDEDYIQRDKKHQFQGLNTSPGDFLEQLYPNVKKLLSINDSSAFQESNEYFHKQHPPESPDVAWEDKLFPPNKDSLLKLKPLDKENVTEEEINGLQQLHWEKAKTLFRTEYFSLYDTLDVEDVSQGALGNCYFLSVLAVLASNPDIYDKVFVDKAKTNNGVYRVRFLIRGIPKIICVDDFFPANEHKNFAFAMSGRRELWVQVLEKAWAKVNGSYASTIAGLPSEAFTCLNEAPCMTYFHWRYNVDSLWGILKREKSRGFYIATNTSGIKESEEKKLGLVSGHAYSVTNLFEFIIPAVHENPNDPQSKVIRKAGLLRLIQLRNPWSYFEWKGRFNDDDEQWKIIPNLKEKVGFKNKDDGVFFMDFNDFVKYFPYTYVLKYHRSAFYKFKKIEQQSSSHMSCCKFFLRDKTEVTVGLHLKQPRFYSKVEDYQVQAARVILAKFSPETKEYSFISGEFGTNEVLYTETTFKLSPGEYHIFVNQHWPYNTPIRYTISTYSRIEIDILELSKEEVPSNYLEQILVDYLDKNVKRKTLSKFTKIQVSDNDNHLGFYMFLITNTKNEKYIFRSNFIHSGCEFLQSNFLKKREKYSKGKSQFLYVNDVVECPILPNERKLLVWKLYRNQCNTKFSVEKKHLFEFKENVFDLKGMELSEKLIEIYPNIKKIQLETDIEYTETQSNNYVFVIFKNTRSDATTYFIEYAFNSLENLTCEEDNSEGVIVITGEQSEIIKLKKNSPGERCNFEFTYSYGKVSDKV